MKNGFSTLNRLFGKKKDSNNNLSKSSINLSVSKSDTNIRDSSQMPQNQNKITPLPIATSNAPFEQTFRITVLLPKDQLYVARLGAKILLHKLLQLVCENKQLDVDKYEFQHPADPSQVFSCDLTIGEVGLSEIRLCNKSESNTTFQTNEVIKLNSISSERNSFSSSRSSQNSKNILNTPSLYSSRNSLSSMNSSGINTITRHSTPKVAPQFSVPVVVPPRKKRLAPRPPSQIVTPKNDAPRPITGEFPSSMNMAVSLDPVLNTALSVSSPNLNHSTELTIFDKNSFCESNLSVDCNGNTNKSVKNSQNFADQIIHCQEVKSESSIENPNLLSISNCEEEVNNVLTSSNNNIEKNAAIKSTLNQPAPSPRKKIQTKPRKAIPVAPPRSFKSSTENINETLPEENVSSTLATLQQINPVALPRSTSRELISEPAEQSSKNVSKTIINQSPPMDSKPHLQINDNTTNSEENISFQSKQSDSGIEESLNPSWNNSSTQNSQTNSKSNFESSSDDDEVIKVYDLKLGKTIVKTFSDHKTIEDVVELTNIESAENDRPKTPVETRTDVSTNIIVDSSNSTDTCGTGVLPSISITTKTKKEEPEVSRLEHTTVNLVESQSSHESNLVVEEELKEEIEEQKIINAVTIELITDHKHENLQPQQNESKQLQEENSVSSETKQLVIIPDESADQGVKIIKEVNTSSNQTEIKQKPLLSTLERLGGDEEILDDYSNETTSRKNNRSITLINNIPKRSSSITILDSFQSIKSQKDIDAPATQTRNRSSLATRSSSFLSLAQFESENQQSHITEKQFRRRRSSSELSIGESPGLESLKVIKSILNSRKNSVTSLCGTEEPKTPPTECDIQSIKQPSPKINILEKTGQEKIYRYSGPPNINFSTWNERPKSQISIKNEENSIFNGTNGSQNARNRDTVDLVQQRNNHIFNSVPVLDQHSPVKKTVMMTLRENGNINYANKKQVAEPENSSAPSTMPKFIVGVRTSNPWPVTPSPGSGSVNYPLLRSTSITKSYSKPVIEETQPAFGQSILRKTGLKEKILFSQADDDQKINSISLKKQTNAQTELKTPPEFSFRTEPGPVKTLPAAPPPPPPPIIRAVVTKQSTNRSQNLTSIDPRDQLLTAIRSFKREKLKNTNINE